MLNDFNELWEKRINRSQRTTQSGKHQYTRRNEKLQTVGDTVRRYHQGNGDEKK